MCGQLTGYQFLTNDLTKRAQPSEPLLLASFEY